jgi:hypothetical protein
MCIANLVLTYGVIRRLREHTTTLSRLTTPGRPGPAILAPGSEVPEFTAVTTEGVRLTRDWLSAESVVAFLSPDCRPCKEQLPLFVSYAAGFPGGRDRLLAVVVGSEENAAEAVGQLGASAHVVVTGDSGTDITRAFSVSGFPAFITVGEDGTVRTSGYTVADLPVATRA